MLTNITIENVMTDQMYNDLGFTVRDKLMILVEAQSKWSINIILRAFMYLASSYQKYFRANNFNLYGSKTLSIPEPELYVIYSGDQPNVPETLTMSNAYFRGKHTALEVSVRILKGEGADIVGQYVRFCKVFNLMVKKHGTTDKAVRETIRICKDKNVLRNYLITHEMEVISIMMSLFDKKYIQEAWGNEIRSEAKAEGKAEGFAEGITKGKNDFAQQVALNMHKSGIPQAQIAKMTGCKTTDVAKWIKSAVN